MKDFSVYYQNIRGLKSKTDLFSLNVILEGYDAICFTRRWLDDDNIFTTELFSGVDYNVYRKTRDPVKSGKSRGGGVIVAIRSCYDSGRIFNLETDGEHIWVKIEFLDTNFFLCSVYFTDSSPADYNLFYQHVQNFRKSESKNSDFIICGDFNLPIE